ncbi:MAG: NAD(P)/FAD-dependent oxidoreductase, partial [Gemmatimonadaceae bacterium]
MAFVDQMLRESDATFTIVDRRPAPGGHWNDAYPFVRLHQPSACYGVSSRKLGQDRKDETGFNKGLYELASGFEVAGYFHQVMRDTLLPSGRVNFLRVSEILGDDDGP